jgi:hypothetical protein
VPWSDERPARWYDYQCHQTTVPSCFSLNAFMACLTALGRKAYFQVTSHGWSSVFLRVLGAKAYLLPRARRVNHVRIGERGTMHLQGWRRGMVLIWGGDVWGC